MPGVKYFDGITWRTVSDTGSGKLKVSSTDGEAGYLEDKLINSEGIAWEVVDSGAPDNIKTLCPSGRPATESTLGMIKVGANLSINSEGVLSGSSGGSSGDGTLKINSSDTSSDYLIDKLQFSPSFTSDLIDIGGGNLVFHIAGGPATTTSLGMVQIGNGLTADDSGVIEIDNTKFPMLDGMGKIPSSILPSYVDDVIEVSNHASLPETGETGKIYVILDKNNTYRWSGTAYIQVGGEATFPKRTIILSGNNAEIDTVNYPNVVRDTIVVVAGMGVSGVKFPDSATDNVASWRFRMPMNWDGSSIGISISYIPYENCVDETTLIFETFCGVVKTNGGNLLEIEATEENVIYTQNLVVGDHNENTFWSTATQQVIPGGPTPAGGDEMYIWLMRSGADTSEVDFLVPELMITYGTNSMSDV